MPTLINKIASLLAVALCVLPGTAPVNAQILRMPDIIVQEGATHVDVPIYASIPDSAVAIQFSVVWSEFKLRLDSVKFNSMFHNGNFTTLTGHPAEGEVRVGVLPVGLDLIPFDEDSAAFILSFELLSDFKGFADVRFNPDFSNTFVDYYANGIPATTRNGNISSPGETTSNQNIAPSTANIKVYPNPVQNNLRISGLPDGYLQSEVSIIDKLGRKLWSDKLTSENITVPETLPNGNYWLVINLKEGTCTKPIVLLR